jgi:hypothetical protein
MIMTTIKKLREKYKPKPFGCNGRTRLPPGGGDVLIACEIADRLESIIRQFQCQQPTNKQDEIEKQLWAADAEWQF